MDIGILTFHSAHNFGAALQAMALQSYVDGLGLGRAELVDYTLEDLKSFYSLSPFHGGPRSCAQRLLRLGQRYRQAKAFKDFSRGYMRLSPPVEEGGLEEALGRYDALIYGSDQIWNDGLTGGSSVYFGQLSPPSARKIAYGASFGSDSFSPAQRQLVREHLNEFYRLSIREPQGLGLIEEETGRRAQVVVDPVFLPGRDFWAEWCRGAYPVDEPYVLYYTLQRNEKLVAAAQALAEERGLKVLSIHPTARRQQIRGRQLYDVGPRAFVELIKNAQLVCTNSFHGMAFSSIFGKQVFHMGHTQSKGRAQNLLDLLGVAEEDRGSVMDLSLIDPSRLELAVEASKAYLKEALT